MKSGKMKRPDWRRFEALWCKLLDRNGVREILRTAKTEEGLLLQTLGLILKEEVMKVDHDARVTGLEYTCEESDAEGVCSK